MRIPRLYSREGLQTGSTVELDAAQTRYVVRVLRLRENDPLIMFDGRGGEYFGIIQSSTRETTTIKLNEHRQVERESGLRIYLAQGLSRSERMDYTIQKAVELGVATIQPLFTENCTVRLDSKRIISRVQHWQGLIIAACQQCGRNRLPEIHQPQAFDLWLQHITGHGSGKSGGAAERYSDAIILDHRATTFPGDMACIKSPAVLLVGPEGGLSMAEHKAATNAGFRSMRIGPRILRTETAALTAITVLQVLSGDLG